MGYSLESGSKLEGYFLGPSPIQCELCSKLHGVVLSRIGMLYSHLLYAYPCRMQSDEVLFGLNECPNLLREETEFSAPKAGAKSCVCAGD